MTRALNKIWKLYISRPQEKTNDSVTLMPLHPLLYPTMTTVLYSIFFCMLNAVEFALVSVLSASVNVDFPQ